VVARRFRPRTFAEIVGQDAILRTLAQALESGRIPHAFLFAGSRGVGKTTLARIFARCLNCERGPTPSPCGECAACREILSGRNPDVVEIDAASHNLVEDVRELRERVGFVAMSARYKVYILDEVHMLTRNAFNAFLKTLEEPPPRVVFIMATTELHKVPETIRSRCQVLHFRQVSLEDIARRLRRICEQEGVAVDDAILDEIARGSRGAMRDAETALERILPVARAEGAAFDLAAYRAVSHRVGLEPVVQVVEALFGGEASPALRFVDEVIRSGLDERETLGEVLEVLRAVLLLKVDGEGTDLVDLDPEARARLIALARAHEVHRIDAMVQAGLIGRERLRTLEDRRLVLELALLRMAVAAELPTLGELAQRVEAAGGPAPAAAPGAAPPPAPAPRELRRAVPSSAAPPAVVPEAAVVQPPPEPAPGALGPALQSWLASHKPLLAHTIAQCDVAGPDAVGFVTLRLVAERKLHRDRLDSPGVQQTLREGLRAVLGRDVKLRVLPATAGDAPPAASPPPAGDETSGSAARRVAEKFDGQILEGEGGGKR
jgi:DNA polymerase-3 subunit gamma/tau